MFGQHVITVIRQLNNNMQLQINTIIFGPCLNTLSFLLTIHFAHTPPHIRTVHTFTGSFIHILLTAFITYMNVDLNARVGVK